MGNCVSPPRRGSQTTLGFLFTLTILKSGPWQQRYCEPLDGVSVNTIAKSEMTHEFSQRKSLTYEQVNGHVLFTKRLPSEELNDPKLAGVAPGKNKQRQKIQA